MGHYIQRNHVVPTKLFAPKDEFPILLNCIDVQRHKKRAFHEATIDDCWNTHGKKSLSDLWIGVTRFALLNKYPPEGCTWAQGTLTQRQVTTRPGPFDQKNGQMCQNVHSAKPYRIGVKKNPKLDVVKKPRTFPSFLTMIMMMKRSHTMPAKSGRQMKSSGMPCEVTNTADPNVPSWRRPSASV